MLIVKVYVNERQIDEVHIQNVEHVKGDVYSYQCKMPDLDDTFVHKRDNGYLPLLIQVLQVINRRKK